MERSRIIKAALALDSFTIGELAAHAAANANTVRSYVTGRDRELYELIGAEQRVSRGRPRRRYRLREREAASVLLRDDQRRRTPNDRDMIRRAGEPLALPAVVDDGGGGNAMPAETGLADRLEWAASRLSLALEAVDPEEIQAYAEVARDGAREVIEEASAEEIAQDARLVEVFAQLLCSDEEKRRATLLDAATEVAELVNRASTSFAGRLLQTLTTLARRFGESPPIAVVAHTGVEPTLVLGGLGGSGWKSAHLAASDDMVWWPKWASPLYECQALAGVVVDHTNEPADKHHFDLTIQVVKSWRRPTIVCNFEPASDWAGRALMHGAAPQPTFDADQAVSFIGQSLEDLAVGAECHSYVEFVSPKPSAGITAHVGKRHELWQFGEPHRSRAL